MAGASPASNRGKLLILRAAAIGDIALGVLMAIAGNAVQPLGEIAPGVPLWWAVGAVLAISGIGLLLVTVALGRRTGANATAGDIDPVQRG